MSLYGDGDGDDATTPRATAVEGGRLSLAELSETLSSGPLVRFPGVSQSDRPTVKCTFDENDLHLALD